MASTFDSKFLFTGGNEGILVQIDIQNKKIHKNFGVVEKSGITSMKLTSDDIWLFTGSMYGNLKQWHVETGRLFKTIN